MKAIKCIEVTGFSMCLLLLASCTSFLRSDVVTFHEGPLPAGETIRVVATDQDKAASLEFRSYARLIAGELEKIGYTPIVDPSAPAMLVASIDYSVENGPLDLQLDRPTPLFVRYHFYYGRFRDPFYFGIDNNWNRQVISTPSYIRNFTLNIERNDEPGSRLFEGRVRSVGRQAQLTQIMPYLVTAMFTNFPGESGVTKMVTIEMDE